MYSRLFRVRCAKPDTLFLDGSVLMGVVSVLALCKRRFYQPRNSGSFLWVLGVPTCFIVQEIAALSKPHKGLYVKSPRRTK
jgi:hypothetical protein